MGLAKTIYLCGRRPETIEQLPGFLPSTEASSVSSVSVLTEVSLYRHSHAHQKNVSLDQTLNPLVDAPTIKRKYLAEAGLHLFSPGPVLFRPSDIYRFGDHPQFRTMLEGTNVYLICRRRRIAIDPHSIEVKGGGIYGNFVVHGDSYHQWETERFSCTPEMLRHKERGSQFVAAQSMDAFGHAIVAIDQHNEQTFLPSCALVARGKHSLGERTKLEVLYVGQTFGKEGNRLSVDRLSRHTTLQRILAEVSDETGQDEILLLGLQYSNPKNLLSSAGGAWVEPSASSDEEQVHLMKAGQQTFRRKDRILLAEAALINHFKPRYNIMHRDSFSRSNSRKLKTLQSLLKEDFSALIVEINTSNIRSKLWSAHAPRGAMSTYFTSQRIEEMRVNSLKPENGLSQTEFDEWIKDNTHAHIAKFSLYEPAQRETFLHGLLWSL